MTFGLFLCFVACGLGTPAADSPAADSPADARVAAILAEPVPEDSLYRLDLPLVNAQGEPASLATGRGHPTLVSMFYASCPMACPMLIGEVQALEQALSPQERADLRVVLVSLDPDRDTPEALAEAIELYGADRDRWLLARTEEEHVRTLAAVLGIKYRALADGEMNHSSIVTLLDRRGRIVSRVDGLGKAPDSLVRAIRQIH